MLLFGFDMLRLTPKGKIVRKKGVSANCFLLLF